MASLNRVFLIGRLGKDPDVRYTADDQQVATMSVATDESYTSNGQKHEKTEWHRVVAWGKTADFCARYLAKGRLVYVEGKLQTRKWADQSGAERYTTEILAARVQGLDRRAENEPDAHDQSASAGPPNADAPGRADSFPSEAAGMDHPPF